MFIRYVRMRVRRLRDHCIINPNVNASELAGLAQQYFGNNGEQTQ